MTQPDLRLLERNCQLLVWIVDGMVPAMTPGITTRELDAAFGRQFERQGARSLYQGYQGYPASCSLGVNDVVSYALPTDRPLADGDLLHVQMAVEKDGGCAILERTFPIGDLPRERRHLWLAGKRTLRAALGQLKGGTTAGDLSAAIDEAATQERVTLVREWQSHGVGRQLVEPPDIPHYRTPRRGPPWREGAVLQVRPLVTAGKGRLTADDRGWNLRTADGAAACLMGHTVAVEPEGVHVLSFGPWDCQIDETPARALVILGANSQLLPVQLESIGLHLLIDSHNRTLLQAVAHLMQPERSPVNPAVMSEFESVLNAPELTLYDLQLFLEKYPDFLPAADFLAMRTTLALPQRVRDRELPDLLVEPLADARFDPGRLGLPFKPLTVDDLPPGRLPFYLHAACDQLRRFLPFYDARRCVEPVFQATGVRSEWPCMGAVFGRTLDLPPFVRRQLDRRLPWVGVTTIEKLHRKARHRLGLA